MWQLEGRFFKYDCTCKNYLTLVALDKGKYVSVNVGMESLLYYSLLHAQRKDQSRTHLWSAFDSKVAPWKVALAVTTKSDSKDNVRGISKALSFFKGSLEQNGISVVQIPLLKRTKEETVLWADQLGIPFLISLDQKECEENNSIFEITATIRNRDTKKEVKRKYMDTPSFILSQ